MRLLLAGCLPEVRRSGVSPIATAFIGLLCAVVFLLLPASAGCGAGEPPAAPAARNALLNIPLFSDDDPWDDDARALAERLGLAELSAVKYCTIYQAYPNAEQQLNPDEEGLSMSRVPTKKYRVCGEKVVYAALYARDNKPQYLYFVFANMGDLSAGSSRSKAGSIRTAILDDYNDIGRRMTKLLGKHEVLQFATPYTFTSEIRGWQIGNTMVVITCPYNKMAELRIMPAEWARTGTITDGGGVTAADLAARIQKSGNDSVLTDLLMIDQGPKGYCVPATCERWLRYYGFHTEYYMLSVKMETRYGGGTTKNDASEVIDDFLRGGGLKRTEVAGDFRLDLVRPYLDRGLPLLWYMKTGPQLTDLLRVRLKQRGRVDNEKEWRRTLDQRERTSVNALKGLRNLHVCLLIGYNPITREVALTNSWGKEYVLHWLTENEAAALSQKGVPLSVVEPQGAPQRPEPPAKPVPPQPSQR